MVASAEASDPNLAKHFVSKAALKNLTSKSKPRNKFFFSTDLSKAKLHLWTPEKGKNSRLELDDRTTNASLEGHEFDPGRPTKIICHGWRTDAIEFVKPFLDGEACCEISVGAILASKYFILPFAPYSLFIQCTDMS